MTHVLVVDDSAVVRQTITALLHTQHDIETTIAADPLIAMEKMKRQRPDVILLDLEMPRMDGLTFLKKVMAEDPTPVIICSGHVGSGSEQAMLALENGAVELIAKPKVGLQAFLHEAAVTIVDSIRAAAAYRMPDRRRGNRRKTAPPIQPAAARPPALPPKLIAIGASTGGPETLRQILPELPAETPGIVVVQHMPEFFTGSFARHLDLLCQINVREAKTGDEVVPGTALIAPGNRHMTVYEFGGRFFVDIADGPLVSRHRPSVDVLLNSVARCAGGKAVGVILTGMGNDGAEGLREMKNAGAYTLAQDEASCAVFGMPREAIRSGAVCETAHASRIASILRECFRDA